MAPRPTRPLDESELLECKDFCTVTDNRGRVWHVLVWLEDDGDGFSTDAFMALSGREVIDFDWSRFASWNNDDARIYAAMGFPQCERGNWRPDALKAAYNASARIAA